VRDHAARLAIVTGGTKGLGYAFSERLADLDYHVQALYRQDEAAAELAGKMLGQRGQVRRVDIADRAALVELTRELVAEHGAPAVLVNNAGRNIDRPLLELSEADWQTVLETNLSAPFHLTSLLAPAMLAAGGGSIVNVGATTGIRPRRNGANYCASKAGLLHLTKCMALELAPTIRVNCLIPGMIDTEEMRDRYRYADPEARRNLLDEIPQGRIGTPAELADALEFLVSDSSRYLTGQKLIIDGGQFMW
jgi:acetoacetyl-CoA reductase/3-oxoacyl-[acyl-carrier protein] reductase